MQVAPKPSSLAPKMTFGGRTAYGNVNKKTNEDSWTHFEVGNGDESIVIAVVADGVGGLGGGALASRIAVSAVQEWFEEVNNTITDPHTLDAAITAALHHANSKVIDTGQKDSAFLGMSTTVILAAIAWGQLQIAYVGDSRAYLLRNRRLSRLTLDHAWAQNALDKGIIKQEDLSKHPNRNVIDRFLGAKPNIDVDRQILRPGQYDRDYLDREFVGRVSVEPGDTLLLCSDGLNSCVSDDEIEQILRESQQDPQRAANRLVVNALKREVNDNTTVLVLSTPKRPWIAKSERRSRLMLATTAAVLMLCIGYLLGSGRQDGIVSAIQNRVSRTEMVTIIGASASVPESPPQSSEDLLRVTSSPANVPVRNSNGDDGLGSSVGVVKTVEETLAKEVAPQNKTLLPAATVPPSPTPTVSGEVIQDDFSPQNSAQTAAVVSNGGPSSESELEPEPEPQQSRANNILTAGDSAASIAPKILVVTATARPDTSSPATANPTPVPPTSTQEPTVVTTSTNATQARRILVVTATPLPTQSPVELVTPLPTPTASPTNIPPVQQQAAGQISSRALPQARSDISTIQIIVPSAADITVPTWQEFNWTFSGDLGSRQMFEVVLWEADQDPVVNGISISGASRDTYLKVNFTQLAAQQPSLRIKKRYFWGILLVNTNPYQRLRLLYGGQSLTFLGQ